MVEGLVIVIMSMVEASALVLPPECRPLAHHVAHGGVEAGGWEARHEVEWSVMVCSSSPPPDGSPSRSAGYRGHGRCDGWDLAARDPCWCRARSPEAGTGHANESTSNQATPGARARASLRRPSARLAPEQLREPPYFPGLLRLPSNKTPLLPPPRFAQPRLPSEPSIVVGSCAYFSLVFSSNFLPLARPYIFTPSSHLSPRRRQPTPIDFRACSTTTQPPDRYKYIVAAAANPPLPSRTLPTVPHTMFAKYSLPVLAAAVAGANGMSSPPGPNPRSS